LHQYTNAEQDYIRAAFYPANYVQLARIPAHIKPGETARARNSLVGVCFACLLRGTRGLSLRRRPPPPSLIRASRGLVRPPDVNASTPSSPSSSAPSQIESNLRMSMRDPAQANVSKHGLFQEFSYIPSRYSLADEARSRERLLSEAKRLEVGGRDFVCAGKPARLKYEDTFEDREYRYPSMSAAFEAAQNESMRQKWLDDSRILHGPFRPSGHTKPLSGAATRAVLPELLRELEAQLRADWGDAGFELTVTEADHIVLRFDLSAVESRHGLLAYMNVLSTHNATACKYALVKVVEEWCKEEEDFLTFSFRPPWVAARRAAGPAAGAAKDSGGGAAAHGAGEAGSSGRDDSGHHLHGAATRVAASAAAARLRSGQAQQDMAYFS
jgi:hypothetical protein